MDRRMFLHASVGAGLGLATDWPALFGSDHSPRITGNHHHSVFPLSKGETAEGKLRELCLEGLHERYEGNKEMMPGGQLSQLVLDRLDRELGVINKLDAENYFLIVWDFIHHVREIGIPSPDCGAKGGALVCYSLYISHFCPLQHGLLFEPFFTVDHKYPEGIYFALCKERGSEVILYLKDKYGKDRVTQTGFGGVLLSDRPLPNYLLLADSPGIGKQIRLKAENAVVLHLQLLDHHILTHFSKVVNLIEQSTGDRIDLQKLPLDDEETFQIIRSGDTILSGKLSCDGFRDLLRKMKSDRFLDIVAATAIYRPGPLRARLVERYIDAKRGRNRPEYKIDVVEEVLAETYGVLVYQEQVMQILNRVGRISMADAYKVICVIKKRREKTVAAFYEQYMEGATCQGVCETDASELWEMILKYTTIACFGKSHAMGTALRTYQRAFVEAHYPREFKLAFEELRRLRSAKRRRRS